MIKIKDLDDVLSIGKYPDGTPAITTEYEKLYMFCEKNDFIEVCWFYDNMEEFFALQIIVAYLKDHGMDNIILNLPYCPNARMDRAESDNDVLIMKYFGKLINSLGFKVVRILDPHSSAVENTIDRAEIHYPLKHIQKTIEDIGNIDLLFYPDHGSESRYSPIQEDLDLPYLSGYKQRDWKTGRIEKLQILGDTSTIKEKNILIIDDICSKGGTFLYSAKALKEYGAADIYLYVTHCENTILQGEIINSGLIKKIYTTNSIYRAGDHPLIEVFDLEEM